MADLLAHPFRIGPDGRCVTVIQGSDQQYNQLIAVTVGTRQGEREMCLPFGLVEAGWRGVFAEDVQAAVDQFGPPIVVGTVMVTVVDGVEQVASLHWQRADDPALTDGGDLL